MTERIESLILKETEKTVKSKNTKAMKSERQIDFNKFVADFRQQLVQSTLVVSAQCVDLALKEQGFKCEFGTLVDIENNPEDGDLLQATRDDSVIQQEIPDNFIMDDKNDADADAGNSPSENGISEPETESALEPEAIEILDDDWTISEANPGDVIECLFDDGQVFLVMYADVEFSRAETLIKASSGMSYGTLVDRPETLLKAYCGIFYGTFVDSFGDCRFLGVCSLSNAKFRLASKIQRGILFDEIKKNGLRWNDKEMCLELCKTYGKFKNGQFIISNDKKKLIARVCDSHSDGYEHGEYVLEFIDGTKTNALCSYIDSTYREWGDINDNDPGDVIVNEVVTKFYDHIDIKKNIFIKNDNSDYEFRKSNYASYGMGIAFNNGIELHERDVNPKTKSMEYVFEQRFGSRLTIFRPAMSREIEFLHTKAEECGYVYNEKDKRFVKSDSCEISPETWVINKKSGKVAFVSKIVDEPESKRFADLFYVDGSTAYVEYDEFLQDFDPWKVSNARENDILYYNSSSTNLAVMFDHFFGGVGDMHSFVSKCAVEIKTDGTAAVSIHGFHEDGLMFVPATDEKAREFMRILSQKGYELKDGKIVRKYSGSKKEHIKEGDWIVYEEPEKPESRAVLKVADFHDGVYRFTNGCELDCKHEQYMRIWTYSDVQDGDVLINFLNMQPFIIKGDIIHGRDGHEVKSYCGISVLDNFITNSDYWTDIEISKLVPADDTERQKLFSRIKKEGYSWNDDTKELVRTRESESETNSLDLEPDAETDEQDDSAKSFFAKMSACYERFCSASNAFVNEWKKQNKISTND